jgi:hypothetical protein
LQIDELNLDLQRVHEWAAVNGLKLNPIKSQVKVISLKELFSLNEESFGSISSY